ncbi:MAG TPA: hypothetical protein VHG10_02740, partial [Glycomyces sp.]|nr:hypothetical protein [Glycomyces sp.]
MRRFSFIFVPIAGLAAAAALAACGSGDDDPAAADGEINVVTAFYPLAFAAERVGDLGVELGEVGGEGLG